MGVGINGAIACLLRLWCVKHDRKECFDCFAGSAITIRTYYPGSPNQQWERADPFIRNRATPNKVLDIASEYRLIHFFSFYYLAVEFVRNIQVHTIARNSIFCTESTVARSDQIIV